AAAMVPPDVKMFDPTQPEHKAVQAGMNPDWWKEPSGKGGVTQQGPLGEKRPGAHLSSAAHRPLGRPGRSRPKGLSGNRFVGRATGNDVTGDQISFAQFEEHFKALWLFGGRR